MNMNIGETIKKLRKQKDMTQEQLAEYLNISPQAISRWEISSTLPDITLIPMLANIFDVSADVLLGIDIEVKEKRIKEISDDASGYSIKGYKGKALEILRNGLKEYPNSYHLMLEIIKNLWVKTTERTEEDKKEVIYFCEKILAECTDDNIRHVAICLLSDVYSCTGENEKAEKLALKMPSWGATRDNLLTTIYSGDKKHKQIRQNIYLSIMELYNNIKFIIHYPLDNGNNPYTTEERIILHKKFIEIIDIIFDDGNYGGFFHMPETSYRDIAIYSVETGNYEDAVENLKTAYEYVIKHDENFHHQYDPEKEYTSLFLKGMKLSDIKEAYSSPNNHSKNMLEFIQGYSLFDPIRQNKGFIEIVENLKKYAKNNDCLTENEH